MKSWEELDCFDHVDMQDSFVLGWKCSEDTFFIDMEASLWPGHTDYETPQKGEHTCYKFGRLIFRKPRNVVGLKYMNDATPNPVVDPDKIPDYGNIDTFTVDGENIHITGDFGDVTFLSPKLEFKVAKGHIEA